MSAEAAKQAATNSFTITATATIPASAEQVYNLLSDYNNGHPKILPPQHFKDLVVEKGGKGAGTVIRFKTMALGVTNNMQMFVSEPEPGRVLVESDPASGIITTFTLKPLQSNQAELEIATQMPVRAGFAGAIEKFMTKNMMKSIYRKELRMIADYFQAI